MACLKEFGVCSDEEVYESGDATEWTLEVADDPTPSRSEFSRAEPSALDSKGADTVHNAYAIRNIRTARGSADLLNFRSQNIYQKE